MHNLSTYPATDGHARADHDHDPAILEVQFDDLEQQKDSSIIGMWLFLATEVMFFGGLILAYAIYRISYPRQFELASHHMFVGWGFFNTIVLLTSSLTMALAVRASQLRDYRKLVLLLIATMVLGTCFLGVKAIEYHTDYEEHLIPGPHFGGFQIPAEDLQKMAEENIDPRPFQMFYVLYFFMTGLHALHMIVGIGLMAIMAYLSYHRWFSGGGEIQIEVAGLYWHFVDIVWVFLYPLLYLISVHS
jgi:cytochrome c oxidase subunit III